MKQFLIYVLATIAGIFVTMFLCMAGSFLMLIMMVALSGGSSTPSIEKHSILHIDLSGEITERKEALSLLDEIQGFENKSIPLNDLIASINHAATDSKIDGIYLECNGGGGGQATMTYIVEALNKFKESGKWVVAYGDTYSQGNYYLSSAADSVWLNPIGAIDIHGLGGELMFYKGLLDKLGVEVQVIKVGTYKSAVEPFILTEPSPANVEQVKAYITPIWNYMSYIIAESRNVSPETVNEWADSMIITQDPSTFVDRNVVNALKYRHEVESSLKKLTERDDDDDLRLVSPTTYVQTIKKSDSDNRIAVLYAVGDIVDSGKEGIVGDKMAPLILDLADDDDIDALILRVNSGGGSAYASEQIWEALEQFKAKGKPFYVSMGDVVASGGYYISCGADKIFCQPVTITGSIGIFGMIPSLKGLMKNHLGITTTTIATNPNGEMSVFEPLSPVQRQAMQNMINRGYETFVGRCAQGRGMPVDSIKAIAEGRVWDGMTAQRIGLVDGMANLTEVIETLAEDQGYDTYKIVEYPNPKLEWWEEILLASEGIQNRILDRELGETRMYYDAVNKIKNMNPIQCRMQDVVIK